MLQSQVGRLQLNCPRSNAWLMAIDICNVLLVPLGEMSNIPTSTPRNAGRNISNISGYSDVFARDISGALIVGFDE